MYKFFVEDKQINDANIFILNEDVNHIVNVLRLKTGEKINICNRKTGENYIGVIDKISREQVKCTIIKKMEDTTESNINIDVYQGLPKIDKMEYIIQKSIEIGAKNIFPVRMERCIVKLDENAAKKKIDRWQKIAEASAKQSKRDLIPNINSIITLKEICQNSKKYDIILLAYENENNITIKDELKKHKNKKKLNIGIIVGPEGGLDEKEVELLQSFGIKSVSLGKRILRTETAAIVMLSDIIYEFEL